MKRMFSFLSTAVICIAFTASSAVPVAKFGQCGGIGYTGSTVCVSGCVCTKLSDFYSQCLPV